MSATSNKVKWMWNFLFCWILLKWQYLTLCTQIISCLIIYDCVALLLIIVFLVDCHHKRWGKKTKLNQGLTYPARLQWHPPLIPTNWQNHSTHPHSPEWKTSWLMNINHYHMNDVIPWPFFLCYQTSSSWPRSQLLHPYPSFALVLVIYLSNCAKSCLVDMFPSGPVHQWIHEYSVTTLSNNKGHLAINQNWTSVQRV